jgi:hypothetical protein
MDHSLEGFDFVSQHALNILTRQAARNAGRVVVLAGSSFLRRELQIRLKNCGSIWMYAGGSCASGNTTYPLSKRGELAGIGNDGCGNREALILACPLAQGNDDGFSRSLIELPSYRNLHVLTYGWLSRLGLEWRFMRTSLSSVGRVRAGIREAGWVVDKEYVIYGLRSAAWGFLAKTWACLGRQDLADRCYYAMREALVNTDGTAGLAVFVVIRAKRSMRVWPMAVHEEIPDYTSMGR